MSTNKKNEITDISTLALNIDRLMRRIHADLHPRAAEFDHHSVGPIGGMLLLTIAEYEPADIRSVVKALGRDKSQISRLIQRLERKGLLRREKSSDDARVFHISLTETGQAQLNEIKITLSDIIGDMFRNISNAEQEEFARILETLLLSQE